MTLEKRRLASRVAMRACAVAIICSALVCPAAAAPQRDAGCDIPVLTLSEAATLLRVDAAMLERLAGEGALPGRRIGTEWRFDCATLMRWLQNADAVKGRGLTPQAPDSNTAQQSVPGTAPAGPVGEAPEDRTAEDVFLRGNRLLLGRGDVVIDVGQFFARRDSLQLAAVGTGVGLATLQQHAFTTLLVGRVGIFRETEVFASTVYSTQDAQQVAGALDLGRTESSGFGATTMGIRRTLLRERARRPDLVVSLNGRAPKGEILPAAGGGLVVVKAIDPVVLFASGNYVHPFERSGAATRPVDTIDLTLGYGLGLNDATAVSMAVSGLFAVEASSDATTRAPSAFTLRFSVTTALGQGLYLEPSVNFGLSGPGQTFGFGITMPFAF